jgi:tRNA A37 methylthiotransferase MiaB
MIVGFCNETEEDHQDTLSLMKEVEYDYGYMLLIQKDRTWAQENGR